MVLKMKSARIVAAVLLCTVECSEPQKAPSLLRARFPQQAAAVLEREGSFDAVAGGFVAAHDRADAQGAEVQVLDGAGRARLMVRAPAAFDESGKSVPVRLRAVGADTLELYVDCDGLVLADPSWSSVGSMTVARARPSVTPLRNGKV